MVLEVPTPRDRGVGGRVFDPETRDQGCYRPLVPRGLLRTRRGCSCKLRGVLLFPTSKSDCDLFRGKKSHFTVCLEIGRGHWDQVPIETGGTSEG